MFNFPLLKRKFSDLSYKFPVCMMLMLSGVFIGVCSYDTDIVIAEAEEAFLFKELLKLVLICYVVHLLYFSRAGFLIGAVFVIYTGISAGIYLMFVINNMSVFKIIMSVIPVTIKAQGILEIYSDMFMFELRENKKNLILGGGLYFLGDIIMSLML